MKVEVNWDACEGNAVCMSLAPDIFKVERDEKAHLLQPEPPAELRDKIEEAVRSCPTQAISLVDD